MKLRFILFFLFGIMTLQFSTNFLGVIRADRWQHLDIEEHAIMSRIEANKLYGVGSFSGFLGWCRDPEGKIITWEKKFDPWITWHSENFENDRPNCDFNIYFSNVGLAGWFAMPFSLLPRPLQIPIWHMIYSMLAATVIFLLCSWLWKEVNPTTAFVYFIYMLFNPFASKFWRNPWWTIIAFGLFILWLFLNWGSKKIFKDHNTIQISIITFFLLLIKACFGFEHTSTFTWIPVTAVVFIGYRDGINWKKIIKKAVLFFIAGCAGFFASLVIWFLQLSHQYQDSVRALNYMAYTFLRRTNSFVSFEEIDSNPQLVESLNRPFLDLFRTYLFGDYKTFHGLTLILILGALWGLLKKKWGHPQIVKATLIAIVLSYFGAFSWLIIAHQHSVVHPQYNHIGFELPLGFFTCLLLGLYLDPIQQRFFGKS